MIPEIYTMRKRQHSRENAPSPFAAHDGIRFLTANQRSGMEAMLLKSNFCFKPFKFSNIFINTL